MTPYKKGLQLILPMLPPFEQDVLTMLHGLDGNPPQTRKAICEKLSISIGSIVEMMKKCEGRRSAVQKCSVCCVAKRQVYSFNATNSA